MMGRLGKTVREDQGLAYYSYSRLSGGMGPGPWHVSAGVNPANVRRAVDSIVVEIERLIDEPVSEEERLIILRMLEQKKITMEQAEELLSALEGKES